MAQQHSCTSSQPARPRQRQPAHQQPRRTRAQLPASTLTPAPRSPAFTSRSTSQPTTHQRCAQLVELASDHRRRHARRQRQTTYQRTRHCWRSSSSASRQLAYSSTLAPATDQRAARQRPAGVPAHDQRAPRPAHAQTTRQRHARRTRRSAQTHTTRRL
jgi:hypothetical protein